MANWAQGPLALGAGPSFVENYTRQPGYLCMCILPMRRSLFNGQLGPGALGPGPSYVAKCNRHTGSLYVHPPNEAGLFNGQLGPGALGPGSWVQLRGKV